MNANIKRANSCTFACIRGWMIPVGRSEADWRLETAAPWAFCSGPYLYI